MKMRTRCTLAVLVVRRHCRGRYRVPQYESPAREVAIRLDISAKKR